MIKYLVQWKRFTVEYDSWKKEEDLENVKKAVAEFKRRLNVEIQRQKKLEERDFRRGELLGKYIAKMLYEWDNKKFKEEYLKKLERNWQKQKLVSLKKKL